LPCQQETRHASLSMTWHVWHTRPRHPPFPITDSRFIPPTGAGGTSPENQKNGTTLLKITQLKIYAKFRLNRIIGMATKEDDYVLDFFAGSGSTGHAVIQANCATGIKRRFILVQIPEPLNGSNKEQKDSFEFCIENGLSTTVAELTKERIRRAGKKIKTENALTAPNLDIGFRVLKIDSSNMKDVYYAPDAVQQADLLDQVDNIREDRTPEDLLFQVLLDWGVGLNWPITQETIAGKVVFFVDGNALAACFETGINEVFVKTLAARHPLRAVFRDAGFGSDSVKINIEQIFKLVSPTTEVKSI